jgi:ligand-binding sensor domain-containing protein
MGLLTGRSYVGFGVVNGAEIFLDTEMGEFVSLTKATNEFELRPIESAPVSVFDAVPDHDNYVLSATAKGLIRFGLNTGEKQVIHKPNKAEEFKSIVRDSSGRLWVAGDRLYVSSDEGMHWAVVSLPMLSKTYIKRLRSNGSSGLVITLYDRGVVFLEW